MLIRISGAMTCVDLSTMVYVWRLEGPEPAWDDRLALTTERVFHLHHVYEANLSGGFIESVLKIIVSNTYVEEVLDTVKERFIGCVLAHYTVHTSML